MYFIILTHYKRRNMIMSIYAKLFFFFFYKNQLKFLLKNQQIKKRGKLVQTDKG